jgi:hypothetical protein
MATRRKKQEQRPGSYYWEKVQREGARYRAEIAERQEAKRLEEERKTSVHMARSPKTRAAEAQLLGEKVGGDAVRWFSPMGEAEACIRRTCLAAQREALQEAKQRMRRLPSHYVGMREPSDDLERRAFLRGAWWSIKRRLAPICQPEVADGEQEGLFGLGKRRR